MNIWILKNKVKIQLRPFFWRINLGLELAKNLKNRTGWTLVIDIREVILKIKVILSKNSFFSHSKNYLIGDFFQVGLSFLTVPIFTRLLLPSEYGILAIFTSVISIFTVILGLNSAAAIGRRYYEEDSEFSEFLGTILVSIAVFNIGLIVIFYIGKDFLASFFSIDGDLFFLAIVASCFGLFCQMELFYLNVSQQSQRYIAISVVRNGLMVLAAIIWVYLLPSNRYLGKVYSQLLVMGIGAGLSIYTLANISKFDFKVEHIRYALAIGIPLIPHVLAGFVLAQFDRVIINQLIGSYETGLYSFAYNVGTVMNVLTMAMNKAWLPILYEKLSKNAYSEIQQLAEQYAKIIFFGALGLIFFSQEIVYIMASESYFKALDIIPVVILSYVMIFLYTLFANYSFYKKKNALISLFTLIAGGSNIGLNYLLIPYYGYGAAAWTTLISFVLLFFLHYAGARFILEERTIRLPGILSDFSVMVIAVLIFSNMPLQTYWSQLLLKVVLLVLVMGYFLKEKLTVGSLLGRFKE